MRMTPAFSPGPCNTRGARVGSERRRCRECLYEQCSFQSALKMPSSVNVGVRPSIATSRSYSSGVSPCSATSAGVTAGSAEEVREEAARAMLLDLRQHLDLTGVEPRPAAVGTDVHLHVLVVRLPEVGAALRALHVMRLAFLVRALRVELVAHSLDELGVELEEVLVLVHARLGVEGLETTMVGHGNIGRWSG